MDNDSTLENRLRPIVKDAVMHYSDLCGYLADDEKIQEFLTRIMTEVNR